MSIVANSPQKFKLEELTKYSQWVCWKSEVRNGKSTKIPINPKTGNPAKTNDPNSWGTVGRAIEGSKEQNCTGIGFVFSTDDPFCGIDLDKCVAPDTGVIESWAQEIIDDLDSYTEFSPSGTGIHILCRAKLPGSGRQVGSIEIYDRGRYFTITQRHLDGTPLSIEERQEEVEELYGSVSGRSDQKEPTSQGRKNSYNTRDDRSVAVKMLPHLSQERCDDYQSWLHVGMALHSVDGDLLDDWEEWSQNSDEFQPGECGKKWATFAVKRDESLSLGSLIEWAREDSGDATLGIPGRFLPNVNPLALADDFLSSFYRTDDKACILYRYQGEFFAWNGRFYQSKSEEELGAETYRHLENIYTRDSKDELTRIKPTNHRVRELLLALPSRGILLSNELDPPFWLDEGTHPNPREMISCENGLLHIPSLNLIERTPHFFNTTAVEIPWSGKPSEPKRWNAFLDELFGDDAETVQALQMWFGYCLIPDTRHQKILMVVGPKRSGKGTIANVLRKLLGEANVCNPTLSSFSDRFGLQPLIGKHLAVIADARLGGRSDQAAIAERLLSISGEDAQTIDRKHLPPWSGKLPTRFLLLTNELPRIRDASGALSSRFILLVLSRSFFGMEDHHLLSRMTDEMSGILKWAVDGWHMLRQKERFCQPESGREAIEQLEELGSPVQAFVRDKCEVGPQHSGPVNEIYEKFKTWCEEAGRRAESKNVFGRDIHAAFPRIRTKQPRQGRTRIRVYEGISIRE